MLRIGISRCLLGERVRYDGKLKGDSFVKEELGKFVECVPVCPECECGLPVPREAMKLVDDGSSIRIITRETEIDHTKRIVKWIDAKLDLLEKDIPGGFILKSRSPSCGVRDSEIFGPDDRLLRRGRGIFAEALTGRFPDMPVEDELRLRDTGGIDDFLQRVERFLRTLPR